MVVNQRQKEPHNDNCGEEGESSIELEKTTEFMRNANKHAFRRGKKQLSELINSPTPLS